VIEYFFDLVVIVLCFDDIGEVWLVLVMGLIGYVCKNGFGLVVVVVFGGIDLVVVVVLVVDVFGGCYVVGIFMFSSYFS